jgi:diguanylate cyclase (GGDEF)-like protein
LFRYVGWTIFLCVNLFICAASAQVGNDFESDILNNTIEEVTYCIDPNWAPYEAIRNNLHVGISAEYLKIIADLGNLSFTLVPTESWQQSLEYVQQGRCQVIPMLNTSDYRRHFLDFSLPYFEAPNVLIAKEGTPMLQGYNGIGNRTVGIVDGYRQLEYIYRHYPNVRLEVVSSEREGLHLLSEDKLDVLVGSLLSMNMHINNQNLKDLSIVGYAEPHDSLAFGVNKSSSHLIPKLNFAIERIPEEKKVEIYKRWNNVKMHYSRSYSELMLWVIIVLLVLMWLIFRNRFVRKHEHVVAQKNLEIGSLQATILEKNRTLAFLSAHDKTTGLYNRNHMIQRAEEEISRFQRFHTTATLIFIDLTQRDQKARVIDDFVHEDILKKTASSCLSTIREVDVVSRFNEQLFIILCPQTELKAAKILAHRLLERMKQEDAISSLMSVYMGLAELKGEEEFSDWYERTLKALNNCKREGQDSISVAE